MKKNSLLGSLEDLDSLVDPVSGEDNCDDDMLEAAELAIMESGKAFDEKASELKMLFQDIDDAESSLERLTAIRDSIAKYGICQATMEASDPDRELVRAGICGAYEELSAIPMKGADADLTVKGIDAAMEGIVDKIKSFFRAIGHHFKDMGVGFDKMVLNYDKSLRKIGDELKVAHVNEERFLETSIRAYKRSEFEMVLEAIGNIMDTLQLPLLEDIISEAASAALKNSKDWTTLGDMKKKMGTFMEPLVDDANIHTAIGLSIDIKPTGDIVVMRGKPSFEDVRALVRALGWQSSDILTGITEVRAFNEKVRALKTFFYGVDELCDKIALANGEWYHDTTTSETTEYDENGKPTVRIATKQEVVLEYGEFTKSIQKFVITIAKVVSSVHSPWTNACSSLLQLAHAAIKAK